MNLLNKLKNSPSLSLILIFGLVSLLGDVTYEGARGVVGPYMATLGASAAVVGFVAGLGEFLGYGLRLISGYLTDRTGFVWMLTIIGYLMIFFIPLLGITNSWQVAATFIVLERVGKAIRTPARDVILSYATKKVGRGFGFGLHEAMDQIGAIIGPLLFAFFLYVGLGLKKGFLILVIPCIIMIFALVSARNIAKNPGALEKRIDDNEKHGAIPFVFWLYMFFSSLSVMGFVNFQIISYHFKVQGILKEWSIAFVYAFAMGVDAIFALIIGRVYDKFGLKIVLIIPLITLLIPFFVFSHKFIVLIIGIVIWGMVMGMYETIMRACVADITPVSKRGFSYGIFNTVFGLSYFLGSFIVGFIYNVGIVQVSVYVCFISFISLLIGFKLIKELDRYENTGIFT
ncbi:MFS transporter [Desulfothermus okinawensis JCM 13304]